MSATFSAPTGPTSGLQAYNLEPGLKNLVPATSNLDRRRKKNRSPGGNASFQRLRVRLAAARTATQGHMEKACMLDTIHLMIETLRKSCSEINAAGVADADDLLAKSFGEFEGAVAAQFQQALDAASLEKRAPDDDLLFKGLGVVGRVANLVGSIANQIANIKAGMDYSGQLTKEDADVPSEGVQEYLDQCLALGELAMRESVNEHVDIAEPDDDGSDPDAHYLVLKSADGDDLRVKTPLPEELAKFATDPALVDAAAIDLAAGIMASFGASPDGLTKLFDSDTLAKGGPGAPPPQAAGAGAEAGAGDPNADPDDGSSDDQDPMGQLNLLGRLLAAAMIQLQSFMDNVGGADPDDPAADPTADPTADPAAATPPPAPDASAGPDDTGAGSDAPPKKKNPFAKAAPDSTLAKADPRVDELTVKFGAMTDMLGKLLKHPEGAKAILDITGGQGLAKGATDTMSVEDIASAIDALVGDEKAVVLTKIARGVHPEQALRKLS
jgi:hypothetical protein